MKLFYLWSNIFLFCESVCYSVLFLFLSKQYEFYTLLSHKTVTSFVFLNEITRCIKNGGIASAAYLILIMVFVCCAYRIITIKLINETFISIVPLIAILIKAISCMILLPIVLFFILDNTTYSIEIMISFILIQILIGLIAYTVLLTIGLISKRYRLTMSRKWYKK